MSDFNSFWLNSGNNAGIVRTAAPLDCAVTWSALARISGLRGKTLRLRVCLKKQGNSTPRLYAIYLRKASAS
jgi:hypothetical protein